MRMAPNVIGFATFVGNVASAARAVTDRAYARAGGYAILGNAHVLVTAKHDALVREAVDGAWRVSPDGAPVAWMQRRAGVRDAERIAGADLMLAVVRHGTEYGLRHALFGSTSHVLERLEARLRFEEPQAVICAAVAPPFASLD